MTQEDRKELVAVVGEALEQIVLPELAELKVDIKAIRGVLETHGQRLESIEATLDDHGKRLNSIEKKLDATITVTDRHDVRLGRLEKHLNLPPLEPALK